MEFPGALTGDSWLSTPVWAEAIKIWDIAARQEVTALRRLPASPDGGSVAWSSDGRKLALTSSKTVKVVDPANGQELLSMEGHTRSVWTIRWSPDGARLASAARDGCIKIWDASSGKELHTLRGHAKDRWISGLCWSPDGAYLASGGWDDVIKMWDSRIGKEVSSLRGHTGKVWLVSWSADSRRLASGGHGGIKVWDAATGREVLSLPGTNNVAWSPDGLRLACGVSPNSVEVLDASLGYRLAASPEFRSELAWQHCEIALSLARSLRFEESDAEIRRATDLAPSLIFPFFERGLIHEAIEEPSRAIVDLRKSLEIEPDRPELHAAIAKVLASSKEPPSPEVILDHARKAAELAPESADFRRQLGHALLLAGRLEEAAATLRNAIEQGADESDAALSLARAHWKLGQREEARRWCARAGTSGGLREKARDVMGGEDPREWLLVLEDAARLPGGEGRHTEIEKARSAVLPELASFASIDAAINRLDEEDVSLWSGVKAKHHRDPSCERDFLERLRQSAAGGEASARAAYLEGRLLQRAGDARGALARYEVVLAAGPCQPEPFLRVGECLRQLGSPERAELRLREGLRRHPQSGADVWQLWLAVCFADLRLQATDVLANFPVVWRHGEGSTESEANVDLFGYGKDVHWLLRRLSAGKPVRFNCGGDRYRDPGGLEWEKDRFGNGFPVRLETEEIAGTDSDCLFHSRMGFSGAASEPGGFRIPLPRGRHIVALHFAQTIAESTQAPQMFDVKIERKPVLEAFRPFSAGRATAQARSFEVEVTDGFLDIEFVRRSGNPWVNAIEIRRIGG